MNLTSTNGADTVLLFVACPPSVLFVALYGLLQPWYATWWGRALFVSSSGLAAFIVMNTLYRVYGWPLLARNGWLRVILGVYVVLGTWLMLGALLRALYRAWQVARTPTEGNQSYDRV